MWEEAVFISELLSQKLLDIGGINLCFFLWEAHGGQEVTWINLQVVIKDDKRALLLESPDALIELLVLVLEQLLVHRVIGQQRHVVSWSLHDAR